MPQTITSRILIQLGEAVKRLVNITSIYKGGEFFEYKITLDGFPKGNWVFIKGAKLHSVDGFVHSQEQRQLQGTHIEIGYHADGKTAYKDVSGEWNIKPMVPNIPIRKINKPKIFFRIAGFRTMDLVTFNRNPEGELDLLNNLPYNSGTNLTCDFYLSRRPEDNSFRYRLTTQKKNYFRNSHHIEFGDTDENIDLHLHFYETNVEGGPYFTIIRNDWVGKVKEKINYFIYLTKEKNRNVKKK